MKQCTLLIEFLLHKVLDLKLAKHYDLEYHRNRLLAFFRLSEPFSGNIELSELSLLEIMTELFVYLPKDCYLDISEDSRFDFFLSEITGMLMPLPSRCREVFLKNLSKCSAQDAAKAFFQLCLDSCYIRTDRTSLNIVKDFKTIYGKLTITINTSKPEKDPREIARLRSLPASGYPQCPLCKENVGFQGTPRHQPRHNLRTIPIMLDQEEWLFQFSPYAYFDQHCIILSNDHRPMKICDRSFRLMADFVDLFPEYFIGSNADLPVVGGSILGHDHFQGGLDCLPIRDAEILKSFQLQQIDSVNISLLNWPMCTLRLHSKNREELCRAASLILKTWRNYSDPESDILAFSGDENEPHNTITPLMRKRPDNLYELDLILRNNRSTDQHPLGLFHPHQELHHLKKENIGLIETSGIAILPGRLKIELDGVADCLNQYHASQSLPEISEDSILRKHSDWIHELSNSMVNENSQDFIWDSVVQKFLKVLDHASVFKLENGKFKGLERFIEAIK